MGGHRGHHGMKGSENGGGRKGGNEGHTGMKGERDEKVGGEGKGYLGRLLEGVEDQRKGEREDQMTGDWMKEEREDQWVKEGGGYLRERTGEEDYLGMNMNAQIPLRTTDQITSE